jgi:superfamily II DNA or RNA helicase
MLPSIQLRPYQQDAIAEVRSNFAQNNRKVVLCLPTGAGKTVVFSYLAHATIQKDMFAKVLILTNRIELLTQAGGTLERFGMRYEPITADNKKINPHARCYVGMIETFFKRAQKYPWLLNIKLIIIDEAHYGNFKKVFELIKPETYVIGATATPVSASKKDPLSNYYDALVNTVQIPDLIDLGFLTNARTFSVKADRSKLKADSTGEYSDKSQMDMLARREVYAGLLEKFEKYGKRSDGKPRKTIIFNVNVAHSLEVTAMLNEAGIVARHIDGTTDWAERESTIRGYKTGAFPVICNVGILNAGFDDAETDMIVINRATTSLPLWLQSCGRGSRIAPNKTDFVILDMGANWTELGLWQDHRDWDKLFRYKGKDGQKEGVAPVKSCPSCESIISMSARICPECGHEFISEEKGPAPDADFVEIETSMELLKLDKPANWPILPVEDLERIRIAKDRKPGWVLHVIHDRCEKEDAFREELKQLRKLRGYKPGWEKYQEFRKTSVA